MKPIIKKTLIAVAVLAVVYFGYAAFFGGDDEAALSSQPAGDLPADNADLLSLLLELKSITFSDQLLIDPAFLSLQDFTVELAPEPVGRRNPFAQIGAVEARVEPAATTTP